MTSWTAEVEWHEDLGEAGTTDSWPSWDRIGAASMWTPRQGP